MTLISIGLLSFAFVAWFTARAYANNTGAGQTPRGAIFEAWINVAIGFSVNYFANYLLLPMVGASFTAVENFFLGWCYTAISVIRQYAIRRWHNWMSHR